jgi:hypothetical protein
LETTQFLGGLLPEQYFYLSPFYETDYRGLAQIDGVDLSWQPVSFPLHLGVAPTQSVFSFMWQFKAEAELTQVNNPGYTDFTTGGRHALVGETIRANVALFPLNSGASFGEWMDNWVAGRFSFIVLALNNTTGTRLQSRMRRTTPLCYNIYLVNVSATPSQLQSVQLVQYRGPHRCLSSTIGPRQGHLRQDQSILG